MFGPTWQKLGVLLGLVATGYLVAVVPAVGEPTTIESVTGLRLVNAQLAEKARSAQLGLYSLDSRLAATRSHLASVRADLGELRYERAVLKRELEVVRAGEQSSKRRLADRLRQLYAQGDVSLMEVVFGARSLADAMTQLDNIDRIASQNVEVLDQLRTVQIQRMAISRQLEARTAGINAALRSAIATERALSRARADRASYIASLSSRRDLNAAQIAKLEAQARTAQARSQQLTAPAPAAAIVAPAASAAPTPAPVYGGNRIVMVTISGYALPGTTATGIPVGWGVAAVDPRVIPLGTHIWIPGYGEAVAADIGGAIVGTRMDIWFPTVRQAQSWGLQTVPVTIR